MKPVFARLAVLSFLGIMSGISMNAIFLQEGRVVHFDGKSDVKQVVVNVERPRKKPLHYVSSLKTKQILDKKIEDVLLEFKTQDEVKSSGHSVIHKIQTILTKKGYHPGVIDGIAGPTTRAAIMAFEFDRGMRTTGLVNKETLELLKGNIEKRSDQTAPNSDKNNQAQELVAALQNALKVLGYDTGEPDGIIGPLTRKHIKAFERDHKLKITGRISGKLVETINKIQGRPLVLAKLN